MPRRRKSESSESSELTSEPETSENEESEEYDSELEPEPEEIESGSEDEDEEDSEAEISESEMEIRLAGMMQGLAMAIRSGTEGASSAAPSAASSSTAVAKNVNPPLSSLRYGIYSNPDTQRLPQVSGVQSVAKTPMARPAASQPSNVRGLFEHYGYNFEKLSQSYGRGGYTKKELEEIARNVNVKVLTKDKKEDIVKKIMDAIA